MGKSPKRGEILSKENDRQCDDGRRMIGKLANDPVSNVERRFRYSLANTTCSSS